MSQPHESDVAWDLVDSHRSCLTISELNTVFTRLGAGDYPSAIEAVLKAAARERLPMAPELTSRLSAWLDCYHGSPEHNQLRELLARCSSKSGGAAMGTGGSTGSSTSSAG